VGFAHDIRASADEPKQVMAAPAGDTDGSLRFFSWGLRSGGSFDGMGSHASEEAPDFTPNDLHCDRIYCRHVATAPAGKFESVGEPLSYPADDRVCTHRGNDGSWS
jgi:hypothetical protein